MTYRAFRFSEFVEVLVPGVPTTGNQQTFFNFPDLPQIRTTPILSVRIYTPNVCTVGALTGKSNVTLATLKQAFLTLYCEDPFTQTAKNAIDRLPLLELNYINDFASPYVWNMPEFAMQTVVWPKSFISLPTVIGNTTDQVFCLGILYGDRMQVQQ